MTDNLLHAAIEAKIASWERNGLTFKRESPAIAATIRNIMADFRTLLAANPLPAGAVAARIGSHGPCDLRTPHAPHIETSGIVDNGGNIVLDECPGQTANCANCDDIKCMSCVFREVHDVCRDDCPDCCGHAQSGSNLAQPGSSVQVTTTARARLDPEFERTYRSRGRDSAARARSHAANSDLGAHIPRHPRHRPVSVRPEVTP